MAMIGLVNLLNTYILLISYIVYLLCGFALFIAGMVYAASTGAVGQSCVYLLGLGLFFMVVGAVALVGWKMQGDDGSLVSTIIMFVVLLVMIVLYFVLFIIIICAILVGSGARDPVQRVMDDHWESKKDTLLAGTLYEQTCSSNKIGDGSPECIAYFGHFQVKPNCIPTADKGGLLIQSEFGKNCSRFDDLAGSDCASLKSHCQKCNDECKAMLVKQAKDKNIPLCIITIIVCLFLIVVVVMHTLVRSIPGCGPGDSDALCCKGITIFNWIVVIIDVIFSCLGLAVLLGGAWLYVNKEEMGSTTLAIVLFIVGGCLLFIPVAQIFFLMIHRDPIYVLDIILIVLLFVLSLVAVFLGFLSGALVSYMNSLYDSNYAKYRGEYELYHPEYCSFDKIDCKKVIVDGAGLLPLTGSDLANYQSSDETKIADVNRDDLWINLHEALQSVPYKNMPPNNVMHNCDSSNLCIHCMPALEALRKAGFYMNISTLSADDPRR